MVIYQQKCHPPARSIAGCSDYVFRAALGFVRLTIKPPHRLRIKPKMDSGWRVSPNNDHARITAQTGPTELMTANRSALVLRKPNPIRKEGSTVPSMAMMSPNP